MVSRTANIDEQEKMPVLRFESTSMPDKIASEQTGHEEFMNVILVHIRAAGDMKNEVPDIAEQTTYEPYTKRVTVDRTITKFKENKDTGKFEEVAENLSFEEDRVFYTKSISNPWLDKLRARLRNKQISERYMEHCLKAFEAYKARQDMPIDGYALVNWKGIDPAAREKLLTMGINSVEKLASMTEEAIQYYGMGARALKDKARNFLVANSEPEQATIKLTKLENENLEMREMLSAMQQKLAEMSAMNNRNVELENLRDQYRLKFKKDADKRWKEDKLKELLEIP